MFCNTFSCIDNNKPNKNIKTMPKIKVPSVIELQATNHKYNLRCSEDELTQYQDLFHGTVNNFNMVDNYAIEPDVYERDVNRAYRFPNDSTGENEYNAWYVRCVIKDERFYDSKNNNSIGHNNNTNNTSPGKLVGKRVAIKDNISIAGVPMMNGSAIMEGYIPEDDATVVQRILREGKPYSNSLFNAHFSI